MYSATHLAIGRAAEARSELDPLRLALGTRFKNKLTLSLSRVYQRALNHAVLILDHSKRFEAGGSTKQVLSRARNVEERRKRRNIVTVGHRRRTL